MTDSHFIKILWVKYSYSREQQYVHGDYESHVNNNHQEREAYLETSQTFKMEIFTRIINGWKSLPIVIKSSILDIGRVRGSTAGRE